MAQRFAFSPKALDRESFVARFGGVYEHSPWVAETALAEGLGLEDDAVEALAARLRRIVDAAGRERQLALLRAHPELAGKLAVRGELTEESTCEQASAGLDACSQEEFAEFQALNAHYGERFGFPFIIAVRGLGRADILEAFRLRVENDVETEFATALEQVHRIAQLRLEAMAV